MNCTNITDHRTHWKVWLVVVVVVYLVVIAAATIPPTVFELMVELLVVALMGTSVGVLLRYLDLDWRER